MKNNSKIVKTNKFLQKIITKINRAEIISFDIFDTLLLRPYIKPSDLFIHIEKVYNCPLFADARIDAENKARQNHKDLEDITYDMIYDEIDDKFKKFKTIEMQWEENILSVNPELKQIYDYVLKKGKKILIASDMYLPTEFITRVLEKNGYSGWNKIYVSGDINKTKIKGSMYQKILADFPEVKIQKILHIGDNIKSDFKVPQKLGLQAIAYPNVFTQYAKHNRKVKNFYKNKSLGTSVMLSMMAQYRQKQSLGLAESNNYWYDIGYLYAGTIGYGFARFIESVAREDRLDNLIFVSRDGYLIHKIFNIFNSDIKNEYVYAPRLLNLICRLDYNPKNIKNSRALVEYYLPKSEELRTLYASEKFKKAKDYHKFIQKNIRIFEDLAKEKYEHYKKYLSQYVHPQEKIGMIDLITKEFSSQKLFQNTISNPVTGIYWSIWKFKKALPAFAHKEYVYNNQIDDKEEHFFTKNWNFMEFLITSVEYPIVNISDEGKPIYKENVNAYEIRRSTIYKQIVEGAMQFAQDVKDKFFNHDIYLVGEELTEWINQYIDNQTTKDFKAMSEIKISEDGDHKEYIPLFCTKSKIKDFLCSPDKQLKIYKSLTWRTFGQSLWCAIRRPVSLRSNGAKYFQLALFPLLKNQYFDISFHFGKKCCYQIVIGKINKL